MHGTDLTTAPDELVDVEVGRIDPSIYDDPAIFAAEMDRIFKSTWVYVGHESQVAEPGQFRTTTLGLQSVILSRGEDGELYVLENSCAHRGATVCMWQTGTTKVHRCDYHGWTYGPDGRLLGAPFPQRYADGVEKHALGLKRLPRVASYRGFVFASFTPDVPDLMEHLGSAATYIDTFCNGGDGSSLQATAGTQSFAVGTNWKVVLENVPDGYHAASTHRSMVNVVNRHMDHEVRMYGDGGVSHAVELENGHTIIGVDAIDEDYDRYRGDHNQARVEMSPGYERAAEILRAELGEQRFRELSRGQVIGPGMHVILYPNLVLVGIHIREITPVAVDRTQVTITPLIRTDVPDALNELRLRVHEFFYGAGGFAVPDDMEMFERTQLGCTNREGDLVITRGLGLEERRDDGRVIGTNTDETGIRAQYRQWLKLMSPTSDTNVRLAPRRERADAVAGG